MNVVSHLDTIHTELMDIDYFLDVYFSKGVGYFTKQIASVPL